MLNARTLILGLVLATATSTSGAGEAQLTPSTFDEILYRVEVYRRMDFPAEQILNSVETSISARARSAIMAYGPTPEAAIENFLAVGQRRRRARSAEADVRRARRDVLDCLGQDPRLGTFRKSVAQTLEDPARAFDAVTALDDVPVDSTVLRACLKGLDNLYEASVKAGSRAHAAACVTIARETDAALAVRDASLAHAPVSRTIERTRDAAWSMYYRLKNF